MKEKYFFGIILIVVGLGLFLEQLNIISFGNIMSLYWPSILILLGIIGLFDHKSSKFGNSILILVGLMLQINRLNLIDVNMFRFIVPILLIAVGVKILFTKKEDNKVSGAGTEANEDKK